MERGYGRFCFQINILVMAYERRVETLFMPPPPCGYRHVLMMGFALGTLGLSSNLNIALSI
jgi:hypothetical protein